MSLYCRMLSLARLTHDFFTASKTVKITTRLPSPASTFTRHGSAQNTSPTRRRPNGTATLGRFAAALVTQARRGAVT